MFTSVGVKLEKDPKSGVSKNADGLLVFQYENKTHLIVVEAKFGYSTQVAIAQIERNKYVVRAREYLRTHCNLSVADDCVILLGMNMDPDTTGNHSPEVQLQWKWLNE